VLPVTSLSKGRLTQRWSSASSTTYPVYDAQGRVMDSPQTTGSNPYTFVYGYNLAGAMTSMTCPSGRQVVYTYDQAGRPTGASAGGTTYVSAVAYAYRPGDGGDPGSSVPGVSRFRAPL
jgi:YD repeat-containing protein